MPMETVRNDPTAHAVLNAQCDECTAVFYNNLPCGSAVTLSLKRKKACPHFLKTPLDWRSVAQERGIMLPACPVGSK